jgi:hypothetical protein
MWFDRTWFNVPVVQNRLKFPKKSYIGDCSGNIARVKTSFTGHRADQTQCFHAHVMKKPFAGALAG